LILSFEAGFAGAAFASLLVSVFFADAEAVLIALSNLCERYNQMAFIVQSETIPSAADEFQIVSRRPR
jgi:hypothetical protein